MRGNNTNTYSHRECDPYCNTNDNAYSYAQGDAKASTNSAPTADTVVSRLRDKGG